MEALLMLPFSTVGRVVKAAGLRSANASCVGSTPTLYKFFFMNSGKYS